MTITHPCLTRLSDAQLLAEVKRLVARERTATAELIRSLMELDTRRLYLAEGCSSLFTYCTQVLHLSEHAALGRIEVARAARRVPAILDRLLEGSVTVTNARMLAPHLTDANHVALLDAARHKSKRPVIALLAPERLPDAVVTGTVTHDAMGEIMASADVSVFPSETDALGDVVLEAQAVGLPVLVTDRGGPRENMVDRQTGYVWRAGSESDFGWRLAELLVDESRRREMSAAACRYADRRGWGQSLAPLFEAYRQTLHAAGVRSGPPPHVAPAAHV
jgi:hypothetical protein